MSCLRVSRFLAGLSLLSALLLVSTPAVAQVVLQTSFEDEMTDGWTPPGDGTSLTVSTSQANSGTHSL